MRHIILNETVYYLAVEEEVIDLIFEAVRCEIYASLDCFVQTGCVNSVPFQYL